MTLIALAVSAVAKALACFSRDDGRRHPPPLMSPGLGLSTESSSFTSLRGMPTPVVLPSPWHAEITRLGGGRLMAPSGRMLAGAGGCGVLRSEVLGGAAGVSPMRRT